jgi:hypothetical protein
VWLILQTCIIFVVAYYADIHPNEPNQGVYLGLVSITAAYVVTVLLSRVLDWLHSHLKRTQRRP